MHEGGGVWQAGILGVEGLPKTLAVLICIYVYMYICLLFGLLHRNDFETDFFFFVRHTITSRHRHSGFTIHT
jgi:hypothetical protein